MVARARPAAWPVSEARRAPARRRRTLARRVRGLATGAAGSIGLASMRPGTLVDAPVRRRSRLRLRRMSPVVRRAAPAAALVACALAVPAAHAQQRGDALVAQIAQATATPTPGGEPPLTARPPARPGPPTPTSAPVATPSAAPTATSREALPRTGSDAGLIALAGIGLLGLGAGLRWAVGGGAPDLDGLRGGDRARRRRARR